MHGYTQGTWGGFSLSFSFSAGWPSKRAATSQAVTQHSTADQGCIHLGWAPISPGPLVHHKEVLRRLKGESQHQGNTSWGECNTEDQMQGRWWRLQRKVPALGRAERKGVSSWETRGFPDNEKSWRMWAVLSAHLHAAQVLWIESPLCVLFCTILKTQWICLWS